MASLPLTLTRQHNLRLLPAIIKLAGWRFKQMWRFLFVTWLGMLAVVMLACTLPLFSRVAITADLRAVVTNSPDGSNMLVQVASIYPTEQQVQQIGQQLDRLLKRGQLSTYLQGAPRVIVQTPPITVQTSSRTALLLVGYDLAQAAQHVALLHGRLPQVTTDTTVEIALTQDLANSLGLHVGSIVLGHFPAAFGSRAWTLHVVGIVAPTSTHDPFWSSAAYPFAASAGFQDGSTASTVLATGEAVRSKISTLQAISQGSAQDDKSVFQLFWSYPFNPSSLDANNVGALSQQFSDLPEQMGNSVARIQGVAYASPFGALYGTLITYTQQMVTLSIVISFLLLLILALLLFLISMLSDMLVEQQAAIIATLRSRGATRRHVFGTFAAQSIVLGLTALLVGPLLALLLVRTLAQALLTPNNQQALNVITTNPIQAVLDIKWYAVVAIVVALLVTIVAISRASKLDIVTLRRESSRTQHVPLWRRLNLDLLLVLLIVTGYGVYVYLWQSFAAAQTFDPTIYNLLKGLGFIAPPLLIAALCMLFLRLFPHLLRLATSLATKTRSAPALLAFAQIERAPRPPARVIVLLGLALATSCFLLTLIATTQARTSDAATFAVGADFSGPLSASDASKTFGQLKTQYSQMPGVQSATLGYYNLIDAQQGPIHIEAVDADTYAHTALWSTQNSSQSLSGLTTQLVAHRPEATAHAVVYALVDAALWQQQHLSPGASFTLPMNDAGTLHMHFIALAQVNIIPGIYDTPVDPVSTGLLVDYSSYATVYARDSSTALAPNAVWLRTSDDASLLASLRRSLPSLQDRRMLATANQETGTHLDIIGVLAIGVGAALLLALVGTLLASALHASNRLTNFALVRALGMAPRQIAAVLLWEQGFGYALALLLGIGLGTMLTIFVAPVVSLLDLSGTSSQYNPYDVPPVQAVIPYAQLSLLLGGLMLVCLVALLLMARTVSRPSVSQTLRLNED